MGEPVLKGLCRRNSPLVDNTVRLVVNGDTDGEQLINMHEVTQLISSTRLLSTVLLHRHQRHQNNIVGHLGIDVVLTPPWLESVTRIRHTSDCGFQTGASSFVCHIVSPSHMARQRAE